MLPDDRAQPAAPDKPSLGARVMLTYRRLPLWLKVVSAIAAVFLSGPIILASMVYGIVAVAQARRTVGASISVALWGVVVFSVASKGHGSWLYSVILLPVLVALAAHAKPLARSFVPCRTVAWALAWSVPAGVIALKAASGQPFLGTIAAWLLAAAVLGWRVAKSIQDTRMYGSRGTWGQPGPAPRPAGSAPPRPAGQPGRPPAPQRPGAGRGAVPRRARRPRPSGRHPPPAPADLGRGRDGRTRRDDRAGPGQGAGPLDRRLHRGCAAPHGGRHQHRAADAALRVPRPARHRQDDGGPGAGQDLLRVRPAGHARGDRGAPGRPGWRVPRRHRDQDQRARRLRAGRGTVHRRGVQPGQRGRRAGRPVRPGGGAGAAQAGRGQPRQPHHHPGRRTRSRWSHSCPPTPAWPPGSRPG